MHRDLLQWDQSPTIADRYGTIYPRTNIYSPPQAPSQWKPSTCAYLLQWDQALTLADSYGTIYPRTNLEPSQAPSLWKPCKCAEICSSGTRHSRSPGMAPFSPGPVSAVLPASGDPAHAQRSAPVVPGTHARRQVWHRRQPSKENIQLFGYRCNQLPLIEKLPQ